MSNTVIAFEPFCYARIAYKVLFRIKSIFKKVDASTADLTHIIAMVFLCSYAFYFSELFSAE